VEINCESYFVARNRISIDVPRCGPCISLPEMRDSSASEDFTPNVSIASAKLQSAGQSHGKPEAVD